MARRAAKTQRAAPKKALFGDLSGGRFLNLEETLRPVNSPSPSKARPSHGRPAELQSKACRLRAPQGYPASNPQGARCGDRRLLNDPRKPRELGTVTRLRATVLAAQGFQAFELDGVQCCRSCHSIWVLPRPYKGTDWDIGRGGGVCPETNGIKWQRRGTPPRRSFAKLLRTAVLARLRSASGSMVWPVM